MDVVVSHLKLTHAGALLLVQAAMEKASSMGQPQCIAIVDDGCNLLSFLRMDGAKVLSEESAIHKAMSAASGRAPTGSMSPQVELKLAIATGGKVLNLPGGLPIIVQGKVIGGIGIGSGTGQQDREVANFALSQLPGAAIFD